MYFPTISRCNWTHLPWPFHWRWRSSQGTCRTVTSCHWWRFGRCQMPRPKDSPAESCPLGSCSAPDQITKNHGKGFLQPANRVWGKVMFLHLSVHREKGGGAVMSLPITNSTSPAARWKSGRCAFYWNAFLFQLFFNCNYFLFLRQLMALFWS